MTTETMATGPVPAEQHFATKAELAESNARIQAALVGIERNLGEIKGTLPHLATKADIYRITGGAVAVIVAAIAAIIKFLA